MDSEILDQLTITIIVRDVDCEFPKPKRGRKKKADTKINELEDNDVRNKRERLNGFEDCLRENDVIPNKSKRDRLKKCLQDRPHS